MTSLAIVFIGTSALLEAWGCECPPGQAGQVGACPLQAAPRLQSSPQWCGRWLCSQEAWLGCLSQRVLPGSPHWSPWVSLRACRGLLCAPAIPDSRLLLQVLLPAPLLSGPALSFQVSSGLHDSPRELPKLTQQINPRSSHA